MLMIPLPFVIALLAFALFVRELMSVDDRPPNPWLLGFLGLFIFQEILIGLRFGHGMAWLWRVQPFSAALIPPLAYLSFLRPKWSPSLFLHALPLVVMIVILFINEGLLDAALGLNNLIYAVCLILLGVRGSDALGWVEFRRVNKVLWLLWLVIGVLLVSGITDALIVYDFMKTSGANTANIAGWATAFGTIATVLCFAGYWLFSSPIASKTPDEDSKNAEVFENLKQMMETEKLHLDPDINLNRIARRMVLPVRDVSRAINTNTGNNVSHYINTLRIEEACHFLEHTDMPITQIVFASGFNTKSNFNREFSRLKNQSPSEWRSSIGH